MLNIPDSVKALFKTDGTRKNFRVHFPNGEFSDITNENVVQESVKFTESLCSQDTFRFGLAEASVLEFETVGVGNMHGMTIEAGIEIDTSSLSAADIAAIQAGTWDGTLVLAAASDIGYGFFRVPLGVFRVDSCPRNHGAMTHRQVTAYTQLARTISFSRSEYEKGYANRWQKSSIKEFNLYPLIIARIGSADPQYMEERFTKELIPFTWAESESTYTGLYAQERYRLRMTIKNRYISAGPRYPDKDDVWAIDVGSFNYSGALNFIQSAINTYGETIDRFTVPQTRHFSLAVAAKIYGSSDAAFVTQPYDAIYIRQNQPAIYPYNTYNDTATSPTRPYANDGFYASFPFEVKLELLDGNTVINTFRSGPGLGPKIYRYTPASPFPDFSIYPEPSATGEEALTSKRPVYRFDPLADVFADYFASTLELNAEFAKSQRSDGTYDFIRLSNSSPISVVPGDYSDCWWDEYDVEPIGTVNVSYSTEEEPDNIAAITIGTGASQYDMTENKVLELSASSLSSISTLVNQMFAPHANTVAFTPAELTMQGWPWLEAGDALEIEAEDGTLVDTYALRVEMSGIQNLQSVITATGGEIIEEV